jgi:hypothetical protein
MDILLGLFTIPLSVFGMAACVRFVKWLDE